MLLRDTLAIYLSLYLYKVINSNRVHSVVYIDVLFMSFDETVPTGQFFTVLEGSRKEAPLSRGSTCLLTKRPLRDHSLLCLEALEKELLCPGEALLGAPRSGRGAHPFVHFLGSLRGLVMPFW